LGQNHGNGSAWPCSDSNLISNLNSSPKEAPPCGPTRHRRLHPGPNMPYQPTPGLVALFTRTGTTIGNPRAPHTSKTHSRAAFSYVEVAKQSAAMECGSGANQFCAGGQFRVGQHRGVGQGSNNGRGGFQASQHRFHPGYGGRGPYIGYDGGRYDDSFGRGNCDGRRGEGWHGASDCHVIMYCPICDCNEHSKTRCPKWRADKPMALTCGYAVEGLWFFQIPHTTANQ
jgi:hypothetical protein